MRQAAGGGTHAPCHQAGFPAFLAIEQDNTDYPGYHRTTDQVNYLNVDQSVDIAKAIVGSVWDVAGGQ